MLEKLLEHDNDLRHYARRLDGERGEDAYHTAVCDVIARGQIASILNPVAFFRVAIKRSLWKLFRHEVAERRNVEHFLNNDPVPAHVGLPQGRLKHSHCKNGHALEEPNLIYIGTQRACKTCKRTREAAWYRARRKACAA